MLSTEEKQTIVRSYGAIQNLLLSGELRHTRKALREGVTYASMPHQFHAVALAIEKKLITSNLHNDEYRAAVLIELIDLQTKLKEYTVEAGVTETTFRPYRIRSYRTSRTQPRAATTSMKSKLLVAKMIVNTAVSTLEGLGPRWALSVAVLDSIESNFGEMRLLDDGSIVLTTKDMVIDHEGKEYHFGEWELTHHSMKSGRGARADYLAGMCLETRPLRPNFVSSSRSNPHPHVRGDGGICMGAANSPIRAALRRGDLFSIFELWITILTNYGSEAPFSRLSNWRHRKPWCPNCSQPMKKTDPGAGICQECVRLGTDNGSPPTRWTCSSCGGLCSLCGKVVCAEHLVQSEDENSQAFCSECRTACLGCGKTIEAVEHSLCGECLQKHADTEQCQREAGIRDADREWQTHLQQQMDSYEEWIVLMGDRGIVITPFQDEPEADASNPVMDSDTRPESEFQEQSNHG